MGGKQEEAKKLDIFRVWSYREKDINKHVNIDK